MAKTLNIENYNKIKHFKVGSCYINNVVESGEFYCLELRTPLGNIFKVYLERYSDCDEFELWFQRTTMQNERIFIHKNDIEDTTTFIMKLDKLIHT